MSKSEAQVLDFEKICRLCLLEKRSMSSIFSKKKSDKKVPLPVRIMSCASLELYEGDGLPSSICSKCLLSVNQSYAFREQCEQADTTLRQYAQRVNEVSEETSLKNTEEEENLVKKLKNSDGDWEEFSDNKSEPEIRLGISDCSAPEQKEELEDSAACYEYLQVEVNIPPNSAENVQKELEIKTEECSFKQEIVSYGDTEDHWADDETKPLAAIKDVQGRRKDCNIKVECCDSEEESRLLKIPKVNSEETGSKIKIPKPPRMGKSSPKTPKRGRVLKPQFIDCEVCGKSVQRRKFKLHMMVHNGEKPHLCDTCGKSFTWKFALVTHKRVHSGEKPYFCKHCGQSFRSSSRFAEHSTIHTGRRSYVCERCALAFRTSGRLKRHLRIHTGEKPYICSYCERGFSESYNLKQHRRLHTGEKPPHVCYICTQAFIRKKMLVDHLRIHHGVDQPPQELLNAVQHQQQQQTPQRQQEKDARVGEYKISDDHSLAQSSPVIDINISFE